MDLVRILFAGIALLLGAGFTSAQTGAEVVDIPTRAGVTQRFLYQSPGSPEAAVILIAGGHGGIQMGTGGYMPRWASDNFVIRTRDLYLQRGLATAIVDAPSDRQTKQFLNGFRQTPEHVADIKAVIAWLRARQSGPVWLVGTSMGTLSAAYVATQSTSSSGGPDGVVLTSSILSSADVSALTPIPAMALERIVVPVLVVHHEEDGCRLCPYGAAAALVDKLTASPRKALVSFKGGQTRGDPCAEWAHHGFNGQEADVVKSIVDWIKLR